MKQQSTADLSYERRKELNRLEKEISRLEEHKNDIEKQFASPDLSPERINELARQLAEVKSDREDKELRWM
ncbi:MAG: hypothetical protein HUU34_13660 [Saprospiraceae bacterium]|nr:hypothetical protein [Saprospiraceae bacterium]